MKYTVKSPPMKLWSRKFPPGSVACGKRLLEGDSSALTELKEKLASLRAQKSALLAAHHFPSDYLEPIYDCPDCKDTGYIDGQKCHCFKQQMITLLYEQSNIQELLASENFSTLSYNYYSGDDLNAFSECGSDLSKLYPQF